jgi:hypothetical protein
MIPTILNATKYYNIAFIDAHPVYIDWISEPVSGILIGSLVMLVGGYLGEAGFINATLGLCGTNFVTGLQVQKIVYTSDGLV